MQNVKDFTSVVLGILNSKHYQFTPKYKSVLSSINLLLRYCVYDNPMNTHRQSGQLDQ